MKYFSFSFFFFFFILSISSVLAQQNNASISSYVPDKHDNGKAMHLVLNTKTLYIPSPNPSALISQWYSISFRISANVADNYFLLIESEPSNFDVRWANTIGGSYSSKSKEYILGQYETSEKITLYIGVPPSFVVSDQPLEISLYRDTWGTNNELNDQVVFDFLITDNQAPYGGVEELPSEVSNENFEVSWYFVEGVSGINRYDVQYKKGSYGNWNNWLVGTPETKSIFTNGNRGETIYFRARAYDNVGNTSQYASGNGDTYTKILNRYNVSLSESPQNAGTTTGSGIKYEGDQASVSASANTGYSFSHWEEGGSQVSTANPYSFTVTENRSLTAVFDTDSYTISLSSSPSGGGNTSGGGTKDHGATASVSASANTGYSFSHWEEGGSQVSTANPYSFTVTENRSLTAVFDTDSYTISLSSSPSGGGNTSGGGTKDHGATASVSASANTGYSFSHWEEGGSQVSTANPYSFTVTENRSLTAVFDTDSYTISLSSSPSGGGNTSGGGTKDHGATASVSASANTGYSFSHWEEGGSQVSTANPYSFTVTENRSLTAVFDTDSYTISLSSSPSGGGNTSGGGTKDHGATASVSASANTGYSFSHWEEGGSQVSTANPYSFTVTENRSLTAVFDTDSYTISLSSSPSGGGNTSGGGTKDHGATASVSASANTGYSFSHWEEGGSQVSTANPYSFTVTENRSLTAVFDTDSYTISLSSSPSGGGNTSGGGTKDHGATASVSASANTGYSFSHWEEGGSQVSTANPYSFTVTENRSLTAVFEVDPTPSYTISLSASPSNGGSMSGEGTYDEGSQASVSATANTGYSFSHWEEGGSQVSTANPYSFTVTENRSLTAVFEVDPTPSYTISLSASPSNGGSMSGEGTYDEGSQASVSATANAGYSFSHWEEGGSQVSTANPYSFTVTENRSLTAVFEVDPTPSYTISLSASPSNGGSMSGEGTYDEGSQASVSATANAGYSFSHWEEGGSQVSTANPYSFTVTENRSLTAVFKTTTDPTINVPTDPISFGDVELGQSSTLSYTLAASNLTEVLTVATSGVFTVSTSQTSGFGASLTLTPDGEGAIPETPIYVKFIPAAEQSYSSDITHSSTGATVQNVAVNGTGVTNPTVPSAPELISPGNGEFDISLSPLFEWKPVNSTDGEVYELQVAEDAGFSLMIYSSSGSGTSASIGNILDYEMTYYWRVRTHNGNGSSEWSSTWNFTTIIDTSNVAPSVTIVNGPADGSTINFNDPGFVWSGSDSDGTIQGYEVDLQGPSSNGFSTTESQYVFSELADGQYTFRVQAIDNDGAKSTWAERNFTVEIISPDKNEPNEDLASATEIGYGYKSGILSIHNDNDIDVFKFIGSAGNSISISSITNEIDGKIWLIDENGNELASADNVFTSGSEYLEYTLSTDGVFYIRYAYWSNGYTNTQSKRAKAKNVQSTKYGSYELKLSLMNAPEPMISVSGESVSFGDVEVGQSSMLSYAVAASNLTEDLTVTTGGAFTVSTTQNTGFGATLTLSLDGEGSVAETPIYVRFTPTAEQSYSGDITHSSTGAADQSIVVSGTGISTPQPSTDLDVVSVNAPSSANLGGTTDVNITVANNGDGSAPSGWVGQIYLSADTIITDQDTQIGSWTQGSALSGGSETTVTETVSIPSSLSEGDYHVGVLLDTGDVVSESNESNNIGYDNTPITVSPPEQEPITVNYVEGWNLISIPEETSGQKMSDYFSQSISTDMFEFEGSYNTVSNIAHGKAYWVKLNSGETIEFDGSLLESLTLNLVNGWNLVGTTADTLNLSTDIQDPGSIIENNTIWKVTFNSSSGEYEMVEASQMLPGHGYFIKATASGSVTLSKQ